RKPRRFNDRSWNFRSRFYDHKLTPILSFYDENSTSHSSSQPAFSPETSTIMEPPVRHIETETEHPNYHIEIHLILISFYSIVYGL
ncbi:1952_t:CDS:2, partial [Acaulospora colombiana]